MCYVFFLWKDKDQDAFQIEKIQCGLLTEPKMTADPLLPLTVFFFLPLRPQLPL